MGLPFAAALGVAAIPGVANLTSDLLTNRANRKFSEKMYNQTKTDNLAFWNLTNAYNSPQEQMKRFQAAGLNPNLIYGQAGDNSASNIPTPDVVPVNYRAPHFDAKVDPLAILNSQADLKIKAAQANNLNEQTEVIRQDGILRALQAQKTGIDTKQAGFNLDFARDFRDVNADALREHVRQTRVTTDLAINRDAREAIMNSTNVQEAAQRILTLIADRPGFALKQGQTQAETDSIRQNIQNMQKDGRLKDFEIMLNKSNVSKSDPLWQRMIADFLSGDSPKLFSTPAQKGTFRANMFQYFGH